MLQHTSVVSESFRTQNLSALYFAVKHWNTLLVEESLLKLQSAGILEGFRIEKGPAVNKFVIAWSSQSLDLLRSHVIEELSSNCIRETNGQIVSAEHIECRITRCCLFQLCLYESKPNCMKCK